MTIDLSVVKRIAAQNGLLPEGDLPKYPVEKFIDYQDLQDELLAFAKAIYAMGAAEQKEKDAKICESSMRIDCLDCAEAIRSQE